jgi:hypothetical protein
MSDPLDVEENHFATGSIAEIKLRTRAVQIRSIQRSDPEWSRGFDRLTR